MTDTTATTAREIPLSAGGSVEINLSSGDVRVRGTAGDRVVVRSRDGAPLGDEVAIDAEPGRVRIRDGSASVRIGPLTFRAHGTPDLDIDLPATATISLRTMSGDVEATGIAGASRWASASGSLRVAAAGGPLQLESMSGDAVVEATGALDLGVRTVSGDIRVRAPRLGSSDLGTTSGDIKVEAAFAAGGRHDVTSVSGDVEVATHSPVRLETQTLTGDVHGQGPHAAQGGRSQRTLIVGDGSVALSVRTTSGDVRLRVLGAVPMAPVKPVAPVPPVAPAPPVAAEPPIAPVPPVAPEPPMRPEPPVPPVAPVAPEPVSGPAPASPDVPVVNPARPAEPRPIADDDTHAWTAAQPLVDRREAARLDILRALERGDLDIESASRRLEILEEAGPSYFRGWC